MRLASPFLLLTLLTSTLSAAPVTPTTAPATSKPAPITWESTVLARNKAILDDAQKGEWDKAQEAALVLFDEVVAYGLTSTGTSSTNPAPTLDAFRETAWTLRALGQLEKLDPDTRTDLLKYLRAHDALGKAIVFLQRGRDQTTEVYALFNTLRDKRPDQMDKFANLVAALCVVHDKPLIRNINENKVQAGDPLDIFDYFVKNEAAMLFPIRNVPPELLIYVVDTTASVEEMKWAAAKYGKDPAVGLRFFDIRYDYEHFRKGKPKKLTASGSFTLPNILKFGGVCVDQAYYASSVGKAIGVPTAYAVGTSGEGGHAWVGFLDARGNPAGWNFNVGRYPEYRGIQGTVLDPQTGQAIPDSFVSLSSELIATKPNDRFNAISLTDAALRLITLDQKGQPFNPLPLAPDVANARKQPRTLDSETQLDLLRAALDLNRAYPRAWYAITQLAKDNKLSLAQKKTCSAAVLKLCGQKYPDFAVTVIKPIIETVPDPKEQNSLWNNAFTLFQNRPDLAAFIRTEQAQMWENQKQPNLAGECYMNIIERYANAGPFVINALVKAEELLRTTNKADKIPQLYEQTFNRLQRPQNSSSPFTSNSNWNVVGRMYADKLNEAGDKEKAATILKLVTAPE